MKDNKKFLFKYLNAYAPVAQEAEGQQIWKDYIKPYVSHIDEDSYGTAYGVYRSQSYLPNSLGNIRNVPKVVIEAHCDEIAWIITQIEDSGMIRVKRHGGSDNMIASSKSVWIHTHTGKRVRGVFGWPAIHTRSHSNEEGPKQHELWVDTGLKDKKAVHKAGVEVGNIITFDTQLEMMGDYYVGRSLDNKIGGYIIAEVLRKLHKKRVELPFDLYVVNAVQEEVGLHGARQIAQTIQPNLAIVHDVSHNTNTPGYNLAKHGDVKGGMGPTIQYTPQNHRKLNQLIRESAKSKKIPLQLEVGSMGNDTMAFFLENIPTAIISSPLKYMHTTVEAVHKKDVKNAIKLYIEVLKNLSPEFLNNISNNHLTN